MVCPSYRTTGVLEYKGFRNTWIIREGKYELDLREVLMEIMKGLDGQSVEFSYDRNSLTILAAAEGPTLEFNPNIDKGETIFVNYMAGFTNVTSYLSQILQNFNGRELMLRATTRSFILSVDPDEDVPGVMSKPQTNACQIDDGKESTVCGIGTDNACIFLTASKHGFECDKFSSLGTVLLDRFVQGQMNAKRIGNCKNIGRIRAEESA